MIRVSASALGMVSFVLLAAPNVRAQTGSPAPHAAAHPSAQGTASHPAPTTAPHAATTTTAHASAAPHAAPNATTHASAAPHAATTATAHASTPPHAAPTATAHASAAPAAAQPPPPGPATSTASAAPADDATLIRRMQADAVTANPAAARRISQALLLGPSPAVVVAGLDALAVLGRAEGAPAVLRYLHHRRPSIRRHAIAAARAIHTPELVRALLADIGDSSPEVRTDVVTALSEVGGHAAVAPLFTALDRDLQDATRAEGGPLTLPSAVGVGRFGAPEDVRRLLGMLGRAPFGAVTSAMRVALRREDLSEPIRVEIVTAIGRLATHDARTFLDGFIADEHGHDDSVVREARAAASRIAE